MMRSLRSRLGALLSRHDDGALDEEVAAHLDLLAAEYEARGLSPRDARAAARRAFGGVEQMKEEYRDLRLWTRLDDARRDAAYALRALAKAPIFAAALILTLALGIGANTAVFTLIDALAWRPLPVRDPHSLLSVTRIRMGATETGFTFQQAQALRAEEERRQVGPPERADKPTLSGRVAQRRDVPGDRARGVDVAAFSSEEFPVPLVVATGDRPEPPIAGQLVSGNFFPLLGVAAQLGRLIDPTDDVSPNGHPVIVLSDRYWMRRFARDPAIVGRTLVLNGTPFTVIGVTPRDFLGVEVGFAPDVFLPVMMQPAVMAVVGDLLVPKPTLNRTWLQLLARMNAGVRAEQAAPRFEQVYRQHLVEPPSGIGSASGATMRARFGFEDRIVFTSAARGVSQLRQQFSRSLLIVFGIVATVLLIGCANTANLLLARAAGRRRELALRLALGAQRSRLLRQLLVEAVVIAVLAGVAALLVAEVFTRGLVAYAGSGRTPIALAIEADWRTLTFTAALSLLTALVFALVPALRAARVDLLSSLKPAGHVGMSAGRRLRPGGWLVATQVALTMLLLMASGLFVRTLIDLTRPDQQASRDRVLVVRVEPRGSNQRGGRGSETSQRLDGIYQDLLERVRGIAGVRAASMGNVSPLKPESGAGVRVVPGGTIRQDEPAVSESQPVASSQVVYPGYFATLGIGLIGRDFTAADLTAASAPVCIVNRAFVRIAYPGRNPIGEPCTSVGPVGARRPYIIVGVADDSRFNNVREEPQPVVYSPFLHANTGRGQMILYVRVDGDPRAFVDRIRAEVWRADNTVPQYEVQTLADEVDAAVTQERLLATSATLFGGLALALTAIGLHGLLAFLVVERNREIAIRMALGARRGRVIGLVARETVTVVGLGAAVAIALGWLILRLSSAWLPDVLHGLSPLDPVSAAGTAVTMIIVAAAAASLPARRATSVDPMLVLRSE